jgi:hypothetical protein
MEGSISALCVASSFWGSIHGHFIDSQSVLLVRLIPGCVGWFFESVVGWILDSGCLLKMVVGFKFNSSGCTSCPGYLHQVTMAIFSHIMKIGTPSVSPCYVWEGPPAFHPRLWHRGVIKPSGHPYAPPHPFAHPLCSPYLIPYAWKRKRDERRRKREREGERKGNRGIPGSRRCCFPFLLEPWQSRIRLLPPLCWAICKNSWSMGLWRRWSSQLVIC